MSRALQIRIIPWCTDDGHRRGNTHSVVTFDGNGRWRSASFAPDYESAKHQAGALRRRLRKMGVRIIP